MSGSDAPTIRPFGESALLVRFGEAVDPKLNARVHALARVVDGARRDGLAWLGIPVPGYASLLVRFDAGAVDQRHVAAWLGEQASALAEAAVHPDRPALEIAVRYGGAAGPDLAEVARRTGLSEAQVVRLHQSVEYRVYMLGFAPGFGYLGELPAQLELPRRDTPRPRVPSGSVAVAARQTAIYPLSTPGGWHLIGRTEELLWDPLREPPARLAAGDAVRFVAA